MSGSFQPTNIGGSDNFNNYGEPASLAASLSAFTGTNPNGTWSFYIVDDRALDTGSLAGRSRSRRAAPPRSSRSRP